MSNWIFAAYLSARFLSSYAEGVLKQQVAMLVVLCLIQNIIFFINLTYMFLMAKHNLSFKWNESASKKKEREFKHIIQIRHGQESHG